MNASIRELNQGFRQRGEIEVVDDLSAAAHALLALIERWPQDGKRAAITTGSNSTEGMRRLFGELGVIVEGVRDGVA